MGKRKRAPSPKEDLSEQVQSSTNLLKLKSSTNNDSKKIDGLMVDLSASLVKVESQDKASAQSAAEPEGCSDDRPTSQLRISARVQNKQRREENKYDLLSSKKIDGSSQDEDDDDEKAGKGSVDVEEDPGDISHKGNVKKRRRAWELWSMEDKNTFFEALNECGKDFEAIQNYLLAKLRKKNKDQVRHFYYRTLHKISKHIKFSDDVKKSTQELYSLINYGLLRRRIGGTLDERKGQKLQELIHKGSTSVKVKGKHYRVRTPNCRALKRLNDLPDEREQPSGVRVPVNITVELVPANIKAWNHVQSMAHNPRVRISCSMHKTVATIINHLQDKWRSTKQKICDTLISTANFSVDPPLNASNVLRLRPPTTASFNIVNIKPDAKVKTQVVSLSIHSQMLLRKGEAEVPQQTGKRKGCTTSSGSSRPTLKKKRSASGKEKVSNATDEDTKEAQKEDEELMGEMSQEEGDEGKEKPLSTDEDLKEEKKEEEELMGEMSQEEGDEGKEKPLSTDEDLKEEKKEGEEPMGEMSQEEDDEDSDVKIEEVENCVVEPSKTKENISNVSQVPSASTDEDDEIIIESVHPAKKALPPNGKEIPPKPPPPPVSAERDKELPCIVIKDESVLEDDPNYEAEVLSAVKNIKEEITDSIETIHQLMALENVATSREIEQDADVICIGESTRLSAQIREDQKKTEAQNPSSDLSMTTDKTPQQDQDDSVPEKLSVESQDEMVSNTALEEETTYSTLSQGIERAKLGWTANTCGIITLGELYLMFGKNQQLKLEYDFEDTETSSKVISVFGKSSLCVKRYPLAEGSDVSGQSNGPSTDEGVKHGSNSIKQKPVDVENGATPTAPLPMGLECLSPTPDETKADPSSSSSLASPVPKENPPSQDGADCGSPPLMSKSNKECGRLVSDSSGDKKPDVDVSSMMTKLLYLIRLLTSSKGGPSEPCICGGNPQLSKNPVNPLRSPNARGCLNGMFKSPGNHSSKSPRGCAVAMRSPRTPTLNSPLASCGSPAEVASPTQKVEKVKPASAKRLIAAAESSEKCSSSTLPATGDVPTTSNPVKEKGPETQEENLNVGSENPTDNKAGGEFRIPIAPAPRTHCQTSIPSFNAQLTKLLPRYSRPSRRPVRKNMVVQRQLPLLPRLPANAPVFAVKVGNFEEVDMTSSQLSLPISVSIQANSTSARGGKIAPAPMVPNIAPAPAPAPIPTPFPQSFEIPIKMEGGGNKTQSNNQNAISVNVSGRPLLTVKMPSYPIVSTCNTASTTTTVTSTLSTTITSIISTTSSVVTTAVPRVPSVPVPIVTPQTISNPIPTSCALPLMSETDHNKKKSENVNTGSFALNNILSQALGEIPYLSTPPSTPGTVNGTHLESLLNTPSASSSSSMKPDFAEIITTTTSSLLSLDDIDISPFQSPLKASSQVLLSQPTTFSESSLLSTPTHTNLSMPSDRLNASIISPIKLNLSTFLSSPPPPLSPNAQPHEKPLNILLQQPTPHASPPTQPPELQLNPQQLPETVNPSHRTQQEPNMIPQIHIPEGCSTGLPLLGIPMGEMIPVDQRPVPDIVVSAVVGMEPGEPPPPLITAPCDGILPSLPAVDIPPAPSSVGEGIGVTVACVTTATVGTGTSLSSPNSSCGKVTSLEDPLLHSFQESNDKIMDITFANSNSSNSCFSGLLAAACHQPGLEALMMESSLLQTPPRPMLSSVSGGSAASSIKFNLNLDSEAFEGLSAAAPLSPPSSPSRLLHQADTQWLMNSESNEFSLSNLLGSIDASPQKVGAMHAPTLLPPPSPLPPTSSVRLMTTASHVETSQQQMQAFISTLNDNSVDFTAAFARLKNQTKERAE